MAYAALVSLAQTIQHILQHDVHQSSPAYRHEKQNIRSLHDHLILFQAFLEDFPENLADNLEGRIRSVAYEAEDAIESFMTQHLRSYYISNPINSSPLAAMNMDLELYSFDFKQLNQELQIVTEEIATLAKEVMDMKTRLRTGDRGIQLVSDHSRHVLLPPTGKDAMIGFDDNLFAIKARLCGELSELQVIPIFGMGGIGKTTLALNAYDDPLVMERFEIRAWVTISQDYNVKEIVSGLMVVLKPFIKEDTPKNESLAVFQSLKGRRFLIVLDDMWSTKVWDDVRRLFPDDNSGSRIMLTTRLSDVAAYPTDSSSPSYEMHFMDEDQSWDMLRQKVFKQESCPPNLEYIGRMIASSCRGLPLAIVVTAGILSTVSQTRASWEMVAKNVTSSVATNDEQFAKILHLSYVHLPHHLRPCFLYMGSFPEDYEIKASKLIKLWVAEGFLKLNEPLSWEEAAEKYLEDLVNRSLVLVKRKLDGRIKKCSLHDLLRDVCIKAAQEEKFLLNAKKILAESIKTERRVSINRSRRASVPHIYGAAFRTILCFPPWHDMLSSLQDFRYLKVLDAVRLTFSIFPVEVLELFLLRYLAFSISIDTIFLLVPPSISKLQNLQSLFIFSTKRRCNIDLPLQIWKMTQLRHLILHKVCSLLYPPRHPRSCALENLQTLTSVRNFKCSRRMLQSIPNLRKLEVVYNNINWPIFELENLVHLHQLEKLRIDVGQDYWGDPFPMWEKLAFPKTLKKLRLGSLGFSLQDMATVDSENSSGEEEFDGQHLDHIERMESRQLRNAMRESCKTAAFEDEMHNRYGYGYVGAGSSHGPTLGVKRGISRSQSVKDTTKSSSRDSSRGDHSYSGGSSGRYKSVDEQMQSLGLRGIRQVPGGYSYGSSNDNRIAHEVAYNPRQELSGTHGHFDGYLDYSRNRHHDHTSSTTSGIGYHGTNYGSSGGSSGYHGYDYSSGASGAGYRAHDYGSSDVQVVVVDIEDLGIIVIMMTHCQVHIQSTLLLTMHQINHLSLKANNLNRLALLIHMACIIINMTPIDQILMILYHLVTLLAEEEFPKLKFLQILTTNLEHWITESNHFPCLERLMLLGCRNLSEIPDVIGEIPTLELIEVCIQDKSLVESAKRIKEEQQSYGNDFHIRVMNYYEDDY
ncbi:hypothetical protein BUALT_Bualt06G0006200 [Buddleja alternifolia]|uniref:Uncharacterized protein n=1 Tax=Buddleja alternifolia TaxID=168488 RepID=A0AAV6XMH3_9LAMI|nr:hypothetical protein BUALT_Bualt06G0006200 [Buddleja alternifolia]